MNKITRGTSFLSLAVFLASCGGSDASNQEDDHKAPAVEAANQQQEKVEVFTNYQVPTPDQLFEVVKKLNAEKRVDVLNPEGNIEQYTDRMSKALNFGVYAADMLYVSAFQMVEQCAGTYKNVKALGYDLDIAPAFDKGILERMDANRENSDSLLLLFSESYLKAYSYLEENERGDDLGMVLAGGWVEGAYIISKIIDSAPPEAEALALVAGERHSLENLMAFLEMKKDNPDVAAVLQDLQGIHKLYKDSEQNGAAATKMEKDASGKLVLSGGSDVVFSQEQFSTFVEQITALRNKYTKN